MMFFFLLKYLFHWYIVSQLSKWLKYLEKLSLPLQNRRRCIHKLGDAEQQLVPTAEGGELFPWCVASAWVHGFHGNTHLCAESSWSSCAPPWNLAFSSVPDFMVLLQHSPAPFLLWPQGLWSAMVVIALCASSHGSQRFDEKVEKGQVGWHWTMNSHRSVLGLLWHLYLSTAMALPGSAWLHCMCCTDANIGVWTLLLLQKLTEPSR